MPRACRVHDQGWRVAGRFRHSKACKRWDAQGKKDKAATVSRLFLSLGLQKATRGSTPGMPSNAWSALFASYACVCVCVCLKEERKMRAGEERRQASKGRRVSHALAVVATQQAPVFWMRAGLRAVGEGGEDAAAAASKLPSHASSRSASSAQASAGWWNAVQGLLELAFSRSSRRLAELLVRLGLSPSPSHSLL